MAKSKSTLRFWLRTDKPRKDFSLPVTLVYQIQGQREFYWVPDVNIPGTKDDEGKVHYINWDLDSQRAVYVDKKLIKKSKAPVPKIILSETEVKEINNTLAEVEKEVERIETRFKLDNIQFSARMVKEALKEGLPGATKKEEPGVNIVDFIHKYVRESQQTHKYRTLQVYEGLATHLKDYERKYGAVATFDNLNVPFLRSFVNYLLEPKEISMKPYPSGKPRKPRKVKGMNNITIAKQISTLKTLLKIARTIYKINVNPDYQDFKVTRKDSNFEVVTLTNDEFLTLFNFDLSDNKKLEKIRDVFCFSCATGLRYSDLAQLKREHIQHNVIRMTAAKTSQRLDIPLNPYSLAILEKYKDLHAPLPVISGQKTNEYLKELGELAGIDAPVEKVREYGISKKAIPFKKYELMSIHMGRRTFTTLSLEKGMAPQEVMALTGHTTFKAFKRYVDVTNERKKTVMAKAWGEVNDNKLKVV